MKDIIVGVAKELNEGEKRVALVPGSLSELAGYQVVVETGAGEKAGYTDSMYSAKGCRVASDAKDLYSTSDIVLKLQPPSIAEASQLKEGTTLISFLYPLSNLEIVERLAARNVTVFAMDLMPRISRAQSMDALSSQATIAGYKAVLIAADTLPKFFPMLMTAAGTIPPARVFVIGAGVAGLQAIAVAHRLGGVVEAYDVRPAVREQIESLGAKFVELPIDARDSQTSGGYAKAQSEEFYKKQQALLSDRAKVADVVITTALVPGQKAPILVSEEAVRGMKPSSVIVDLAAEQGGNCALTEPGRTVVKFGVVIHGLLNIPSMIAPQASQLYSRNVTAFLLAITGRNAKDLNPDPADELVRGTMVIQKGIIKHEPTKKALEARTGSS